MKYSRADIRRKFKKIPNLQFEASSPMTAFAGLVVFQVLFSALGLKQRLTQCFSHLDGSAIYRHGVVMLLLVVQILVGQRRLRGRDLLAEDPMVKRVLGVSELPDVATVSRMLSGADARSVEAVRRLSRDLVLDRLAAERFGLVTVDFDGSVQSFKGHAEGTAVGFNKVKKGARSYYPLFGTIAQLSSVLDLHHRPGNVHDSNGAAGFMRECFAAVRARLPGVRLETRFDSAFCNEEIIGELRAADVEFTGTVPFKRFPALKARVLSEQNWVRLNKIWAYADTDWKPDSWSPGNRILLFRRRRLVQRKGPLQLDLFEPRDFTFEYKVVVTNKHWLHPRTVLAFHNGRGSQEKLFGEAKQHAALGVIPTRTLHGNQLFTLAAILAHNLGRELQMQVEGPSRSTLPKRPARWEFKTLGTLQDRVIRRVGRLVWPQGRLTLRIAGGDDVADEISRYTNALQNAA